MSRFLSFKHLKLGKEVGVLEGIDYQSFMPNRTTVGVGKASGGIVFFNVKGCRVKPDMQTMTLLQKDVDHLGQIRILSNNVESLFEKAVPGQQIPWKGMTLQEYTFIDGSMGYVVVGGEDNAQA